MAIISGIIVEKYYWDGHHIGSCNSLFRFLHIKVFSVVSLPLVQMIQPTAELPSMTVEVPKDSLYS